MAGQEVDIATLQPAQLTQIGESLNEELVALGKHLSSLQSAVERFHRSGLALEALADAGAGRPLLVPLTQSLYAPGVLDDNHKVLLDVGTGYFVEARERQSAASSFPHERTPVAPQYTPADGTDYCRRKVGVLKENLDKLGEACRSLFLLLLLPHRCLQIISEKRRQLYQVTNLLQRKTQPGR